MSTTSVQRFATAIAFSKPHAPATSRPSVAPLRRALIPQRPTPTAARYIRSPRTGGMRRSRCWPAISREAKPVRMTRCWRSRPSCGQRSPAISTRSAPASTHILSGSTHSAADSRRPRRCMAVLRNQHAATRLLIEPGADVDGKGDDHGVGVLGWATCFGDVRQEVATYLLDHGAKLDLWTAISLDRADDLRAMVARDRSLQAARMTRNQHRCTPLHHAVRKNRLRIVQLLLELGADPNARDATGATALTTASEEGADPSIVAALLRAGLMPDLLTMVNMARYGEAETMLRDDPSRIGPDGGDTIALHVSVSKRNLATIRFLLAHGIDVNAKRRMWDLNHTALHMTIESGAIEIARLLLDAGADPNVRDDRVHATALGWAEFFGRDDMAELIREKGGVQ